MDNLIAFLGGFLLGKYAVNPRPADDLWDDDTPIPPDHPLVPEQVREEAAIWRDDGGLLYRVQTRSGIEWQLRDAEDRLMALLPLE